jgi:hypothetical protein
MQGHTLSGRKLPTPTITRPPSTFELAILRALQIRPLYQGTVPADVKASRRARGRAAKAARKTSRGR